MGHLPCFGHVVDAHLTGAGLDCIADVRLVAFGCRCGEGDVIEGEVWFVAESHDLDCFAGI